MRTRKILSYILSIAFVISSLFLGLYFLTKVSPVEVGDYLVRQTMSSVGISVGVPPNPLNTLAQEILEKEREIQQREDALIQREQELVTPFVLVAGRDVTFYLLAGFNFLLLLLIVLNFYFDRKHRMYPESRAQEVF